MARTQRIAYRDLSILQNGKVTSFAETKDIPDFYDGLFTERLQCDDSEKSYAVNEAINTHRAGIITSTALMATLQALAADR